MFNIIKMDLYRSLKAKSTWIIILIAIFFAFMSIYAGSAITYSSSSSNETTAAQEESDIDGIQFGYYVADETDETSDNTINEQFSVNQNFVSNSQSGLYFILVAIFTVLLVYNEHKTGFIKNIAGQIPNRGMFVISKLATCLVFCILLLLASFIASLLFSQVFYGYINLSDFVEYLPILGIQMLAHIAFCAFMVFMITLTNSSVISIALGVVLPMGVTSLLCYFGSMLLQKVGIHDFNLSNYTITGSFNSLAYNSASGDFISAVIISMVYLVILTAGSMMITKKRDLK